MSSDIQLVGGENEGARTFARFPTAGTFFRRMTGLEHCFPSIFLPKTIMEWPPDGIREVDQVIVAFFFVRRIVFDALEGSDERFFVYFEEVDFSLRTRMDGWSS